MDAVEQSDAIEQATMTRVIEIYTGALRKALKNKKAFLQKISDVDSGKIKPPKYYVERGEVDKWREGFVRALIRKDEVIDGIMEQLNAAGADAAALIRDSMVDIYNANRQEATDRLSLAAKQLGVSATFSKILRVLCSFYFTRISICCIILKQTRYSAQLQSLQKQGRE